MNNYLAVGIAEGFEPAESEEQIIEAWQHLIDTGLAWSLQGWARRMLLGIAYDADKPGVVWLYEHHARLQQMVDRALPGTVNRLSIADQNPKWALVEAHSDSSPVTYYLLDTEKPALQKFASSRPWIKPEAMSERKFVRYKARDGLEIPAYLTIPKGSSGKNLPLVVEIHGGPWHRARSRDWKSYSGRNGSNRRVVARPIRANT